MARYVITGSTGDIGSAVHKMLESQEIISFSRSRKPLYSSTHHHIDLSKPFSEEALEKVFSGIGSVDGRIWCPCESLYNLIQDTALEEVDAQYNRAIRSLVEFGRVLLPKLRKSTS